MHVIVAWNFKIILILGEFFSTSIQWLINSIGVYSNIDFDLIRFYFNAWDSNTVVAELLSMYFRVVNGMRSSSNAWVKIKPLCE